MNTQDDEKLKKQLIERRREEQKKQILIAMKKLDFWTLHEGIALLSSPLYLSELFWEIDERLYYHAIEAGTLNVIAFDKKNIVYDNGKNDYPHKLEFFFWLNNYAHLNISSFEFLEFLYKRKNCLIFRLNLTLWKVILNLEKYNISGRVKSIMTNQK